MVPQKEPVSSLHGLWGELAVLRRVIHLHSWAHISWVLVTEVGGVWSSTHGMGL